MIKFFLKIPLLKRLIPSLGIRISKLFNKNRGYYNIKSIIFYLDFLDPVDRQIILNKEYEQDAVNFLENATSHLGDQLAVGGGNMNKLSQQKDILAERQILVTEKIGDLGDADLAELITRLQALILSKDASQATFSKIGQQTLFDFIR